MLGGLTGSPHTAGLADGPDYRRFAAQEDGDRCGSGFPGPSFTSANVLIKRPRYDPAVDTNPPPAAGNSDPLRTHEAPPAELVSGGHYQFGTYDGPIARINPLDVVTATGARGRLQRAVRNARLKEWEAFQLGDDAVFVLGAIYDTKSISLLQVLVVDKHAATIRRWEKRVPTSMVHVARGLNHTRSHGHVGRFCMQFTNEIGAGLVAVDATHPGRGGLAPLELHGAGRCAPGEAGHLVICHPFADDRALYSHKTMMPFAGMLRAGTDLTAFDPNRSFMILDDHHGDYPSPMQYDWVTGARRSDQGRVEGFNLTDNQVRDPQRYNENAVWLGDQVYRLPAVRMERPDGPWGTWIVRDVDRSGQVDVRFTPTVRSELHVGPRRSLAEYYAPYGWFEGRIHNDDVSLSVDGMFGVGEQKFIRV